MDNNQEFYQWLEKNGFERQKFGLEYAIFEDGERGLKSTKRTFQNGDDLISIPEKLLITTNTIMTLTDSLLPSLIKQHHTSIVHPVQILALFLMFERTRTDRNQSFWKVYIDTLPREFNSSLFWSDSILKEKLSNDFRLKIELKRSKVRQRFQLLKPIIDGLLSSGKLDQLQLNTDEKIEQLFLWAWSCIMTRCIYLDVEDVFLQTQNQISERKSWSKQLKKKDIYCIAPFLDGFNHSSLASTSSSFNKNDRCLHLISTKENFATEIGKQIFIFYGNHSNWTLLKEYGFADFSGQHAFSETTLFFRKNDKLFGGLLSEKLEENGGLKEKLLKTKGFNVFNQDDLISVKIQGTSLKLTPLKSEEKEEETEKEFVSIPFDFLTVLRIAFATTTVSKTIEKAFLDEPINFESELQCWNFILSYCKSRIEDNAYKNNKEQSSDFFSLVLKEQLLVFNEIIQLCEYTIKVLTNNNSSSSKKSAKKHSNKKRK